MLGVGKSRSWGVRGAGEQGSSGAGGALRGLRGAAGYTLVQPGVFQTSNNWQDVIGGSPWILTLDVNFPSYTPSGPGSLSQRPPAIDLILTLCLSPHSVLLSAWGVTGKQASNCTTSLRANSAGQAARQLQTFTCALLLHLRGLHTCCFLSGNSRPHPQPSPLLG